MYAIIKTGGKQYTVKPGDVIDVEKLEGEAGTQVEFPVLFLNDGKDIVTDADALAKTTVLAQIVDQHKGPKAIIFKFKKRKGYKRLRGHRQNLTKVVITEVAGVKAEAPKAAKKAEAPKKDEAAKPAKAAKKADAPKEAKPAKATKKEEAPKAAKAAKPAAKADAEAPADISKMTVAELKAYAAEKGIKIPSSARKAEIIELIQNA